MYYECLNAFTQPIYTNCPVLSRFLRGLIAPNVQINQSPIHLIDGQINPFIFSLVKSGLLRYLKGERAIHWDKSLLSFRAIHIAAPPVIRAYRARVISDKS